MQNTTNTQFNKLSATLLKAYIYPFIFVVTCVFSLMQSKEQFGSFAVVCVCSTLIGIVLYIDKVKFLLNNKGIVPRTYFVVEFVTYCILTIVNIFWLIFWQVATFNSQTLLLATAIRWLLVAISVGEFIVMLLSTERITFVYTMVSSKLCDTESVDFATLIHRFISSQDVQRIAVGYTGMVSIFMAFVASFFVLFIGTDNWLFYIVLLPIGSIAMVLNILALVLAVIKRKYLTVKWWIVLIVVLLNIAMLVVCHLLCDAQVVVKEQSIVFETNVNTVLALSTIAVLIISIAVYAKVNPNLHKRVRQML